MKAMIKLCVIILLILAFFVWFCIVWADNTAVQLLFLGGAWIAAWLRIGLLGLWHQMRLMLPLMLTLVVVYMLFGLVGFGLPPGLEPGIHPLQYWFVFGAVRAVLFLNTLLWVRILFSFVAMDDIESLPLSLHRKKGLLLGRILYRLAMETVDNAGFYQRLIPSNQQRRTKLRKKIKNKLAIVLCLLFVVLIEAKTHGELIDNRLRHCNRRD